MYKNKIKNQSCQAFFNPKQIFMENTMTTITKTQLLRARELAAILHVSQRHVWRISKVGKLPRPVKVGKCVRWLQSDIETWLDMGCPSQKQFQKRKAAQNKKK